MPTTPPKAGTGATWHPYLGIENWFELQQEREDGNPQRHHWIVAPYLGVQLCTPKRWQYGLEMRYYTPNLNHELGRAPGNLGFGDYGILGFFLSVSRGFGGTDRQVKAGLKGSRCATRF